jgi:hypothetical protein
VSAKLDEFEERLEAYMRDDLGVVVLSEEELKQLGLNVALGPYAARCRKAISSGRRTSLSDTGCRGSCLSGCR